jgi:acyl-homoserine lactone acylase PvdQ
VSAGGERTWAGFLDGSVMPRTGPEDGFVLTANEARLGPGGVHLSTLAQPPYRLERIRSLLSSRSDHDVASFSAIQLDLRSLQAERLLPRLLDALEPGPLRVALSEWDLNCDTESRGAAAFAIAYRAALSALAPALGGRWLEAMLADSELPVWWCAALDRGIEGVARAPLASALARIGDVVPPPLGALQDVTHRNLLLGGLGFADRGPFPLPGSIGTICQGTCLVAAGARAVVAPAYRFITDMAEDAAYSTLPGGIDGSPFHASYDRWLRDHHSGTYHRLEPPGAG